MDKFACSQSIHLALLQSDGEKIIRSKGHELCAYLIENTHEIKGNGRHSYHIGTAMYIYLDYIKDTNSLEYKFTRLISYVNLFEGLAYQDSQSVIGAYRLHILLDKERDFFCKRLMGFLGKSVGEILDTEPDEIKENINKLFYLIQYTLFMYCSQDPSSFQALSDTDKNKFNLLYNRFDKKYSISVFDNDEKFKKGSEVLRELYKDLSEGYLEQYEFLGVFPY